MEVIRTLGEIEITPKTKIVCAISKIKDIDRLDIRTYFISEEGKWIPTKKGINMVLDKKDSLIKLLNAI